MAWGRLFECLISEDATKKNDAALILSGLHMTFKVTRSVKLGAPAKAELVVYNASPETRKRLASNGMNVALYAGYEDQGTGMELIFCGNIVQSTDSHIGPEWQTKIDACSLRNSGSELKATTISLSYGSGISLGKIVDDIGVAMGMSTQNTARAYSIKRSGGFSFHGRPTDALQIIRQQMEANQLSLYIDLNSIWSYEPKENSVMQVIYLNKKSGLLRVDPGASIQEQATALRAKEPKKKKSPKELHTKVKAECLLISALQPNSPVYIESTQVEGLYLIEELIHEGDNFGGEWKSTIEAIR